MRHEHLTPKIDTNYDEKGNQLTSTTIVDHEEVRGVSIFTDRDTLRYNYPAGFSDNKSNLMTHRFQFLNILDEARKDYNRKR